MALPSEAQLFNFPFVVDEESVKFLSEHGRVFFLVRGLPGTGKNGLGDLLRERYPESKMYWADKMFIGPNAAHRDGETLALSHRVCWEKIEQFMKENVPVIINRNSNVKVEDVSEFTRLAARYGYLVVIADTGEKVAADPQELAAANTKGLGVGYMKRRLEQWQKVYPIYTGWFLRPLDALFLQKRFRTIAELLVQSGWEVPEVAHPEGQPFCLGRPCWYGDAAANRDYCDSKEVKDAFGTVHTVVVVGYAVVHGLACALVALDETQTALLGPSRADASGHNLCRLLSGLAIAERERVPCEIKLADVVDDEDHDVPSPSERVKDVVSTDSIGFVVLGSCEKGGEPQFVYGRKLENLWQALCINTSVSDDGIGCKDRKDVECIRAFRKGNVFLILDRKVELRSVFGGFYQPYRKRTQGSEPSIPLVLPQPDRRPRRF